MMSLHSRELPAFGLGIGSLVRLQRPRASRLEFQKLRTRSVISRRAVVRCVAEVEVDKSKAQFPTLTEEVEKGEAIRMLKERFDEEGRPRPDQATLEWFLADRRYKVNEAYDKLCGMINWKDRLEKVPSETVEKEYVTGKANFHGIHDVHGR